MSEPTDFERGHTEGYNRAEMDEFRRHVVSLNESVASTGQALTALTAVVKAQGDEASHREDMVKTVAQALAAETERLRAALADKTATGDRRFTRRERALAAAVSVLLLLIAAYAAFG